MTFSIFLVPRIAEKTIFHWEKSEYEFSSTVINHQMSFHLVYLEQDPSEEHDYSLPPIDSKISRYLPLSALAWLTKWLSSFESESASRVPILPVCISFYGNAVEKVMNPSVLPNRIGKTEGQTGFFIIGLREGLVEGKLNINALYSTLKLTLCHIMSRVEGLGKYIPSSVTLLVMK